MTGREKTGQVVQTALMADVEPDSRLRGDAKDVERRRVRRAVDRDVYIPPIVNPKRRAACEFSLQRFCETYLPELFPINWSPIHLRMIRGLEDVILRSQRLALVAPRGTGKTTLTIAAVLWALLYGHRHFLVIVCDTHEHSKARLDAIRVIVETNETLLADFPGPCTCARALDGQYNKAVRQSALGQRTRIRWGGDKLIIFPTLPECRSSGSAIAVKSMDKAIRGLQHVCADGEVRRPDLVLLDDPITDTDALSMAICDKYERKIKRSVLFLAGPNVTLTAVYLGTIIRKDDLTQRFLSARGWQGHRYQLVDAMPENMNLWTQYGDILAECWAAREPIDKATEFYRAHQAEMDAGARPTWPERYREDSGEISAVQFAMNIYFEDEDHGGFYAEFQNDPRDEDDALVMILSANRVAEKSTGLARAMVPDNALALVSGWDIGSRAIHWVVKAVAPGRKVSVIDYGVGEVHAPSGRITPQDTAKQRAMELALLGALRDLRDLFAEETYSKASGDEMPILFTLIDARYMTDVIQTFCRESGQGFGLVMGHGTGKFQHRWATVPKKAHVFQDGNLYATRSDAGQVLYHAHTDSYKQMIHTGYLLEADAAGTIAVFERARPTEHVSFAHHIVAERQVEIEGGKYIWKMESRRRANHWLDASCYAMACVSALESRMPSAGVGMPASGPYRRPRQRRPAAGQAQTRRPIRAHY